VLKDQCF